MIFTTVAGSGISDYRTGKLEHMIQGKTIWITCWRPPKLENGKTLVRNYMQHSTALKQVAPPAWFPCSCDNHHLHIMHWQLLLLVCLQIRIVIWFAGFGHCTPFQIFKLPRLQIPRHLEGWGVLHNILICYITYWLNITNSPYCIALILML